MGRCFRYVVLYNTFAIKNSFNRPYMAFSSRFGIARRCLCACLTQRLPARCLNTEPVIMKGIIVQLSTYQAGHDQMLVELLLLRC